MYRSLLNYVTYFLRFPPRIRHYLADGLMLRSANAEKVQSATLLAD